MDVNTTNIDDQLDGILHTIQDRISEKKSSDSIENIFYEEMSKVVGKLFTNDKYRFITYINIWNQVKKGDLGKIEFYANHFGQTLNIANNREDITGINYALFDKQKSIPISYIFRKNRIFGASFCILLRAEDKGPDFIDFSCHPNEDYPDELKRIVNIVSDSEKEKFKHWVDTVKQCYGDNDYTTHFFFYNGSIYYGKEEKKLWDAGKNNVKQHEINLENSLAEYVLYANIGIRIEDNLTEKETRFIYSFLRKIRKLIEQISFNLIVDIKDYQMNQEAVRAAIAQVMARNMSHNFGAHVLSNLIKTEVYDDLNDKAIKDYFTVYHPLFDESEVFHHEVSNDISSPLKNQQLGYFNQYLKSRMDYLSEVTFGVSNLLITKMMYGEVMRELDQVRILLNYISGVSNFKYRFKLMVVDENGDEKEMTADNDIGVAFPSDVLGCHAFYNIIENIIRNTAKHAKNTGEVTFTIKFKDVVVKDCDDIEEAAGLYCVEIDNGVFEDGIDELISKQNDRLNQSVLEKNNLRSTNLGLLEMESSAAFLRQIDLPEIESDNYLIDHNNDLFHERNGKKRLNILKAFANDVKDVNGKNGKGGSLNVKTGRLGYRFFVQKPKEFLFVGEWDGINDRKRLLNYGVQFIESEKFINELMSGKSFSHQFLIYDDTLCKKDENIDNKLKQYDALLPLRRIHDDGINAETKNANFFTLDGKTLLEKLKVFTWNQYFEKVIGYKKDISILRSYVSNIDDCQGQVVLMNHANEEEHKNECWGSREHKDVEVWIENLASKTYEKLPDYHVFCKGKGKPLTNYIANIQCGEGTSKRVRQELFEAYHNKVILLDERIQMFAEEASEGSSKDGKKLIPCWRLFGSTNVYLPRRPQKDEKGNLIPMRNWKDDDLKNWDGTILEQETVFSLDPNDFNTNNIKLVENYVNNRLENAFILIHYGILERMYNGDVEQIDKTLNEWAEKAKRVVVTSGRGAHSLNLPTSVCFANLSSVLYACVENRNKYFINYLLNQSRRKRYE